MAMPLTHTEWTADMVRALPDDGQRYEVIDGELFVSPAPSLDHQYALGQLFSYLKEYLQRSGVGFAFFAPADVEFSPRRYVQPDLFVSLPVEGRRPREWTSMPGLLLAVEVLSPSTSRLDRVRKRRLYMEEGVPEYWIVDLDARVVERWRQNETRPDVLDQSLEWLPPGAIEAFALDLRQFFADVLDR